eukprot:gb/GECG01006387.1/.p1 GENE.gb/GECG01006387.1/~~gb/GECG01006387.1/.p1  ORF type:complete len:355 (+),score=73.60 gb/GECG01006387.1/:1-1065(+)
MSYAKHSDSRRQAAHQAIDQVFQSLEEKQKLIAQKRKQQADLFVRVQKDRLQAQQRREEVAQKKQSLEDERKFLLDALNSRWMTDLQEQNSQDRIQLNIGGQMFETTVPTLRNDPDSLLAKLPEHKEEYVDSCGELFFDRDWWIFRYILQYLREGNASLPHNKSVLKQLYKEAGFWRLRTMRRDIRNLYRRLSEEEAVAESDLWHQANGLGAGESSGKSYADTRKEWQKSPEYLSTGTLPSTLRSTAGFRQSSPIHVPHEQEKHMRPSKEEKGSNTQRPPRHSSERELKNSTSESKPAYMRTQPTSYFESLLGSHDSASEEKGTLEESKQSSLKDKMKMVSYQPPKPAEEESEW